MSQPVPMPALGESVSEGTITRWLKQVGDQVAVDEPLVEISTDKVDTEIPSPVAGVLLEIKVPEDEVAEVGDVLAVIGGADEAPAAASEPAAEPTPEPAPEPAPAAPPAAPPPAPAPAAAPPPPPAPPPASPLASGYVSPLVRKLAGEAGVSLDQVDGSGVGGRIRREDIAASKPAPSAQPQPAETPEEAAEKLARLKAIAAQSPAESAPALTQLTSVAEVDMSNVVELVDKVGERFAEREGVALGIEPFFVRAAAEALKAHPQFNAAIVADGATYYQQQNIGVTVDTASGPVVAVVHDAGAMGLAGLARSIAQVTARAQTGALLPDDLLGGTFTLTNPGGPDVMLGFPLVLAPQVAILSVGAITKRPVVVGIGIAVRSMAYLSLSYDSRLIDGTGAAKFLSTIRQRLETTSNFAGEIAL